MASLFWKSLVPNIEVLPTQKIFYKQYLYKLELLAHGGQSIGSKYSVAKSLEVRERSYRAINYGGSWAVRMGLSLSKADIEWLEYLKLFKAAVNFDCKIRIEEPRIQIYASNEQDLIDFVDQLPKKYLDYVRTVTRPANDQERELLQSGKKLMKSTPAYNFRINFRDGKYDLDTKLHVLNYLDSLGDIVRVPDHARKELTKKYSNTWDIYIYTKDSTIITFLQLIEPRIIRTIIEMTGTEDINTNIIQGARDGKNT
jgi:hypothetical protein